MQRFNPKRYFDLRNRLQSDQQRLWALFSTLIVSLCLTTLVLRIAPSPTKTGQLIFRPVDSISEDDLNQAEQPPPTLPPAVEPQNAVEASSILPRAAEPPTLIDDIRFTSEQNLTVENIQTLLDAQPGTLKAALLTVGDRNLSLAEVVVGQSYLYSLNPKLLLALLEFQQGLLTNPTPNPDQLDWAMKYQGENENWRGLHGQIRWAARELRRGVRDFAYVTELQYRDKDVKGPIPAGLNPSSYAVVRLLAQTMTPEELAKVLSDGSFVATYSKFFEDPRQTLGQVPAPATPFLRWPLRNVTYITSFFDHEYPFLTPNQSLVSWWGRRETQISYDGHDGWDYGARPPEAVVAAADGTIVWASNSDDGCGVPAKGVVIDHGNGYRTLYWHLSEISVEVGQAIKSGEQLGIVGSTGCAIGPHLHFQTQYLGRNTDPYGWCGSEPDPWSSYPVGTASRWLWADRPNPCDLGQTIAVRPTDQGFSRTEGNWQTVPIGAGAETLWITSQIPVIETDTLTDTISDLTGVATPQPTPNQPPSTATWQTSLPSAGRYRVLTYIPYYYNGHDDAVTAHYVVEHAEGRSDVVVNQYVFANEWADLGTYTFDPNKPAKVELSNETTMADQGIWVGTTVWLPAD
ncbi:peptidoglycan DD-metalloendopeptidase family protein [Herpetosiphon sp. NSE202]|uniref:peptidoglycan DD-metalloendopeptidase family protein n=1 Tax=Herpetosiphon sp. NSE202 TaxID=3351349 RepID=UPI00362F9B71